MHAVMKYTNPDMIIRIHAGGESDKESDSVEMPLDLLKLDPSFPEEITHGHVQYDDDNQQEPDPGQNAGE